MHGFPSIFIIDRRKSFKRLTRPLISEPKVNTKSDVTIIPVSRMFLHIQVSSIAFEMFNNKSRQNVKKPILLHSKSHQRMILNFIWSYPPSIYEASTKLKRRPIRNLLQPSLLHVGYLVSKSLLCWFQSVLGSRYLCKADCSLAIISFPQSQFIFVLLSVVMSTSFSINDVKLFVVGIPKMSDNSNIWCMSNWKQQVWVQGFLCTPLISLKFQISCSISKHGIFHDMRWA